MSLNSFVQYATLFSLMIGILGAGTCYCDPTGSR